MIYSAVKSQSIYSPYSMLGLGEIETRDYSLTSGMAGIGQGIREHDYLNPLNPAALSALDSMKFIFEVSVGLKNSSFSSGSRENNIFNADFKKLALGFRITPRWGMSIGMKPFSNMGYQIISTEPVEGSAQTKDVSMEGEGEIYQLYLSNGFKLNKNWSLGINMMYISGTLKQTENHTTYYFTKEGQLSRLYNTFGLQYHNGGLIAGLTYGYKQNITMNNKTLIYSSSSLIEEIDERNKEVFIPQQLGIGFTWSGEKFMGGVDYQLQKWNGLVSGADNVRIVDLHRLSAGVGFTPGGRNLFRGIRKNSRFQMGGSISRSYIQIKSQDTYTYAVTGGYSLPVRQGKGLLNFGIEYGNVLSCPSSYIRESYFLVTFNYTFFETWFKKQLVH